MTTPMTLLANAARWGLKAPVYAYRYTLSPLIGQRCRHAPTCSEYAIDAIDLNGAWAGGWLTVFRLCRCHPWGTSGFDPAPDLRAKPVTAWKPWHYARFRPSSEPDEVRTAP